MSRIATISAPFADGDYDFRLGFAQLVLLQEARDCGPYVLQTRLATHTWHVEDIAETIRVGLIGGGEKPARAAKLVRDYVQAFPPLDSWELALKIISAAIAGEADEPMGESLPPSRKAEAAATNGSGSTTSQTGNSASPNSTASPPPSGSDRTPSTAGRGFSSGRPSPDGLAPTEARTS